MPRKQHVSELTANDVSRSSSHVEGAPLIDLEEIPGSVARLRELVLGVPKAGRDVQTPAERANFDWRIRRDAVLRVLRFREQWEAALGDANTEAVRLQQTMSRLGGLGELDLARRAGLWEVIGAIREIQHTFPLGASELLTLAPPALIARHQSLVKLLHHLKTPPGVAANPSGLGRSLNAERAAARKNADQSWLDESAQRDLDECVILVSRELTAMVIALSTWPAATLEEHEYGLLLQTRVTVDAVEQNATNAPAAA